MLNERGQLWASRAAQALDARLTNHVVDPSVNPALDYSLCAEKRQEKNSGSKGLKKMKIYKFV